MSTKAFSVNLIADRYASALYDLSLENKCIDRILLDLNKISELISNNKSLKLLINSPLITSNEKLTVLKKILDNENIDNLTYKFINIISNNKRFKYLNAIISKYISINAERRGDVIANITSAEILNDIQKKNIKNKLISMLGEKLSLNFFVDKKIIGGLIVKVGSKMIDSSLSSKIDKLKLAMKGT